MNDSKNPSRFRLAQALVVLLWMHGTVLGRRAGRSLELDNVAVSANLFAEDVYHGLTIPASADSNSTFEAKNLILSPLSIHVGLAMLMTGSAGNTREELIRGLRLGTDVEETQLQKGFHDLMTSLRDNSEQEDGILLQLANRIYVGQLYPIRPSFLHNIRQNFFADAEQVNFGDKEMAANKINSWVRDATRGRIGDIVTPTMLNNQTLIILVNAIHFKGEWKFPFNPEYTTTEDFTTHDGSVIPVNMMRLDRPRRFKYARLPELSSTAVALPYLSQRYSLVVLLPEKGHSLKDVEARIQNGALASIPSNKMRMASVDVRMPKFKLESNIDLIASKLIENLGMTSIMSQLAEFDRMSEEKGAHITNAIHKGVLDVDEAGSEAAAATAFVAQARSLDIDPENAIKFVVDRPFIAYIYDSQTKSILFVARKIM